ncbi:hypothetical protein DVH05_017167 [Phytophthora capsici]|nr:hypothetical protein DVH05_017167 [Phytophthora capsici]
MILIREINDLRGAVVAANNNLQMERATPATAGLGTSTMNKAKTRGNKSLAAALKAAGGDLDVLIDRQGTEIEQLRRAVKALEDKLAGYGLGVTSGKEELVVKRYCGGWLSEARSHLRWLDITD